MSDRLVAEKRILELCRLQPGWVAGLPFENTPADQARLNTVITIAIQQAIIATRASRETGAPS